MDSTQVRLLNSQAAPEPNIWSLYLDRGWKSKDRKSTYDPDYNWEVAHFIFKTQPVIFNKSKEKKLFVTDKQWSQYVILSWKYPSIIVIQVKYGIVSSDKP